MCLVFEGIGQDLASRLCQEQLGPVTFIPTLEISSEASASKESGEVAFWLRLDDKEGQEWLRLLRVRGVALGVVGCVVLLLQCDTCTCVLGSIASTTFYRMLDATCS